MKRGDRVRPVRWREMTTPVIGTVTKVRKRYRDDRVDVNVLWDGGGNGRLLINELEEVKA